MTTSLDRAEIFKREQDRTAEGRALYSDPAGKPIFCRSVTSFLDALGTKVALTNMTNSDLAEQIQLLDTLNRGLHSSEWEGEWQRMLTFSDSIALAVPLRTSSTGVELGGAIDSIAAYQFGLIRTGRFLRGGIAIGEAYADYANITGPALVEAAELESKVAVVPRVLVSDTCIRLAIAEAARGYGTRIVDSEWNSSVMIDADGRAFVNYLYTALNAEADGCGDALTLLSEHRKVVSEALTTPDADPRVRAKHVWVAHYHNSFCELHRQDESLQIGEPFLTPLEVLYPRAFRQLFRPDDVPASTPRVRLRSRS